MSVESIKAQLAGIFAEARLRRPAAGSRREAKPGRLRELIAAHRMGRHFEPYLNKTAWRVPTLPNSRIPLIPACSRRIPPPCRNQNRVACYISSGLTPDKAA